jgi:uncharacterized protein (TIGR02301 family)
VLAAASVPAHISREMFSMKRIYAAAFALFALLALSIVPGFAQFWPFGGPFGGSPYRGYRPPPQGGIFGTLRPFDAPRPKTKKKEETPTDAALKQPESPPAPYEAEFSRLAEVLGALHYLRPLCGEKEARWRAEMQDLLEAEQPTIDRRDRLIASFNRGYQSFELTYRKCTPSADLAINRFLDEGARLSRDIATRYGN